MRNRSALRRRNTRLWLSGIAALCLLLNQWAVAAYVCPQHFEHAARGVSTALPPCHRHADPVQPGLCHQHCHPGTLADSVVKAPTVPPAIVPPLPPVVSPAALLATLPCSRVERKQLTGPPPRIEQLCRFLI